MPRPVVFEHTAEIGFTPSELCDHILDLERWTSFSGYGPLPAIVKAEFEKRTPETKGTVVAITCADGSQHFEEITAWNPPQSFSLKLHNFSPPLVHLATHFDEQWHLRAEQDFTRVVRRFEMYPRKTLYRPLIWAISRLMKNAVASQMKQIRAESLSR